MFSDIAVFYAVNEKDGIPELSGYDNVTIERSTELTDYMKSLCDRTEKIRSRDVDPRKDNMLKVSTDGRKAALDLRLVGKPQIIDRHTKLWNCVKNVMEIYNFSSDNAQIIFCDVSTPSSKQNFNVYSELKTHLIKEGIPQKEIAFIHNYHTEEKKVKLFEKVNCGEVRILIGSTFKLGTGANVQSKLKAIHHLDVPWRPADMVQREGRILRKGNTNETVRIFRYISEGSFDAYSWQLLETKQKFISQFLTGSTYQRTASDLEENVLTYAQVKALALSNENMKLLAEKQNELQRLRILSGGFAMQKANLEDSIPKLNEQLESLNAKYDITLKNSDYLKTITEKEYKAGYQIKKDLLNKEVIDGTVSTEKSLLFFGFSVNIPQKQDNEKPYVFLERNGATYIVKMGNSAAGNARRIINFLKAFDNVIDKIKKQQQEILLKIKNAKKIIKSKNPYVDSISHLESEIKELTSEIDKDSA